MSNGVKTVSHLTTFGWCLVIGLSTSPVVAAESAVELLELMQTSAHRLNYQGKLVYQQETNLNTLKITHSSQGGKESVIYLDPKTGRDVENDSAPDEAKSFSLSTYNKLQPQTQKAYSFDLGAKEWVANIECQVVIARPKDALRYLHRYCIDPKTGMLLKYSLMDRNRQVVEQLMFTEINLDSKPTVAAAPVAMEAEMPDMAQSVDSMTTESMPTANAVSTEKLRMARAAAPTPTVAVAPIAPLMASMDAAKTKDEDIEASKGTNNWSFANLPLGFEKIAEIQQSDSRTQIIVSDGMTSVSIFADTKAGDEVLVNESNYSSGAMNILTQEMGNYMITLMGEVPESTLEAIFKGLKYTPPS